MTSAVTILSTERTLAPGPTATRHLPEGEGARLFDGRLRSTDQVVRPVSSVSFAVGGEAAFEAVVANAVRWMAERNRLVPAEDEAGRTFDVGGGGRPPARAVALEFEEGRFWAGTLDDPDRSVLGRTWVTEITVGQRGDQVHFGARLLNATRGEQEPFVPSLPAVVRQVVDDLPCAADGVVLSASPTYLDEPRDLQAFVELLENPDRRLPVIAIAEGRTRPVFANPDTVARRLAGAAHVFGVRDGWTWEIGRAIGRQLSVFDGAARLYAPGFSRDEADPFEHPLWLTRPGTKVRPQGDALVARVLSMGTARAADYPRFEAVREAVAARALAARSGSTEDAELLALYKEENARLEEQIDELRREHAQWLLDAEEERSRASRAAQELKADAVRYRAQNEGLRAALAAGGSEATREPLLDMSAFGVWVDRNIGSGVWIAPKAVREVEKNGQFQDPALIGEALYALEELYVPMRREPAPARRQAYLARLNELGLEDAPCFTRKNDIRNFPEYAVTYRSEQRWCDQHLKYGGGTDPKLMFRIYYHWHEEEQMVLIGYLPSHLDNNLTN